MNDLQNREFQMLKLLVELCDRLNVRYYLVCGSVLGAVKYGGFIPWDDDMDIGLLRSDYERFIREAPAFLPDWAFLQNYHTDQEFPHIFSKLRDSNTTFIERGVENLAMNHGVYVDIFPLDGYPQKPLDQFVFDIRKKVMRRMIDHVRQRKIMYRLGFLKNTSQILERLDRLYKKYPPQGSDILCNHGNWQGKLEYAGRTQYGKGTQAIFEGLRVIIPEKYDEYLTQKYGDWHADPPEDKKKSHHDIVVCDLDRPYTEYMKI